MAEIKYDIIQKIAVLSQRPRGWERQLNLISWNDGEPKYDIRDWSPDGTRMGKGISLSAEELGALKGILEEMDEIGYEDYFYGDGVCLIEWAELIEELLPERRTEVRIEKDLEKGFDYRKITVEEIE